MRSHWYVVDLQQYTAHVEFVIAASPGGCCLLMLGYSGEYLVSAIARRVLRTLMGGAGGRNVLYQIMVGVSSWRPSAKSSTD